MTIPEFLNNYVAPFLKNWVVPFVTIITSIALVCISCALKRISKQTYKRDAPKLYLELRVPSANIRGEEIPLHLLARITNVGYRNSVLRGITIDGDDMSKEFFDPEKDDIDGTCLKPGEPWEDTFGITNEGIAKLKSSSIISVTELNGNKYPLSKEECRRLKEDLQKY